MYYYKNEENVYIVSALPISSYTQISEKEYMEGIQQQPSEEEIRQQKEAELKRLLLELYPNEEEVAE